MFLSSETAASEFSTALMRFCFGLYDIMFFVRAGTAQGCNLRSLSVTQREIQMIRYEMVYQVTVQNNCRCRQSNIKVTCSGFSFDNGVDASILMPNGDGQFCSFLDGGALLPGPANAVTFRYASKSKIDFIPVSSTTKCN